MKFQIALVHNGESERLKYLRPKLIGLRDSLKSADLIEYSNQNLKQFNWFILFARAFISASIRWRYEKYLKCSHHKEAFCQELRTHFSSLIKFKNYYWYKKSVSIQMAVTKKHFYLISKFVKSEAEYLIVFENDSLIENPKHLSSSISKLIRHINVDSCGFGVLGGGFSQSQLHATNLVHAKSDALLHCERAYTNTAVAYLIPKKLAFELDKKFEHSSILKKSIPIDWILNSFFIELSKLGIDCTLVSFELDPVIHGSRVDFFKSWQLGF